MKKLLLLSIITTTMLFSCNNNTTEQVEDLKSDQAVKIHEGSFAFLWGIGSNSYGKRLLFKVWSLMRDVRYVLY